MSNLGNKVVMAKNLQYYMELNGVSRQDVCDALKIKYTTFTDWVKGNVYPRIDKIELLANYFGIEKSDLVEDRARCASKISVTQDEAELLNDYNMLSDNGKEEALKRVRELTYIPKYQKLPTLQPTDSEIGESADVDTRLSQLFDPTLISDYRGTAGDPDLVKAAHVCEGASEEDKSAGLEKATMLVEAAKKKRKQGKNDE